MANKLTGGKAVFGELTTSKYLIPRVKKYSITTTPTGSEQDTGWDLPTKSIVLDVFVDVTTAEATGTTKTLDVGLLSSESGGDTDGFLSSVSVAATGLVRGSLDSGGQTLGALLNEDESGAGVLVPNFHVCNGTAVSLVYDADDVDWAEFRGDIYVVFVDLTESVDAT